MSLKKMLQIALVLLVLVMVVQAQKSTKALPNAGGPIIRSARFDGVDDFIQVQDHPDLNPSDQITIEAWVFRNNANRCETVVGKDWKTSYWLGFCPDHLRFYPGGLTFRDSIGTIPSGRWTHIAVTFNSVGTTLTFYIDGQLDSTVNAYLSPLTPNEAPLGVGYDPTSDFSENYFSGYLDEVRIWNVVRTQSQIQADMHRQLEPQAGLVSFWRLNGSARSFTPPLHGATYGGLDYTFNGVLPQTLVISRSTAAMTVDAGCNATEYATAERVDLQYGATVYLQHSDTDLYICFEGLEQGTNREVGVIIDRDLSQDNPAQLGDFRFSIDINGNSIAQAGDGSGGFTDLSTPIGSWKAVHWVAFEFFWQAEFRLSRDLLGLPADWDAAVGLDLVELGRSAGSSQRPAGADETLPSTWATTYFTNAEGFAPTTSFSGSVNRQRDNAPLEGVVVQLFTSNYAATSLVDITETDTDGTYILRYTGYSPDLFLVQETDPRGMYSVSADSGTVGNVISANMLSYPGTAATTSYSDGLFIDTDARPTARAFDRHYLIIYNTPVQYSDLQAIIDMKRVQGYQVETISAQALQGSNGRDLAEKIRNWLISRWQALKPAPIYALLVGRGDKIPVRDIGWTPYNHLTPGEPDYHPAWPSDWYYADLDSDWDTDRDGYFGEHMKCRPGETYKGPTGEDLDCPALGDPEREGPYGTSNGTEDDWKAEISIGRLALNNRAGVRQALETSVAFEMSGALDKRNALIAGAMWYFEGRSWNADQGRYLNGGTAGADSALCCPWDGNQPYGNDTAEHLDVTLKSILTPYLNVTTLYETTAPGNDSTLSPSSRIPTYALSTAQVLNEWQTNPYGLVNIAGHGSLRGVVHQQWLNDWNDNNRIENPTQPSDCSEPPCFELSYPNKFFNANLPAPAGVAPVVFANACDTGGIAWTWDGVDADNKLINFRYGPEAIASILPAQGRVAAYIGALARTAVGGVDRLQDDFSQAIVKDAMLLGDAIWLGKEIYSSSIPYDMRTHTPNLFGDPAMSYWGNPVDALSPWPQSGRDWFASGASPYSGPAVAEIIWTADDFTPKSPPIVDRAGNIIVGGENRLVIFAPDGSVIDSVPPGNTVTASPARATDSVYAATGTVLYAYDLDLNMRYQTNLGGTATGEPRLGADGTIWLPTSIGMTRISGVGNLKILDIGSTTSPVAFDLTGTGLWTSDETLHGYTIDRRGDVSTSSKSYTGSGELTAPAVGPDGRAYFGSQGGDVIQAPHFPFNTSTGWIYHTGTAFSARPVIGLDGTVYVGDEAGTVRALSPAGTVKWFSSLETSGVPAVLASPAMDDSHLYIAAGSKLYVLNPATGELFWSLPLGGPTDARSTPVIGGDRTIYLTRSDGVLVAIAESGWLLAPSDVVVTPGITSLTISWRDNSTNETGFLVERCDLEGSCFTLGTTGADVTSFEATQIPADELFTIRVQALGLASTLASLTPSSVSANHASEFAYADPKSALPPLPQTPTSLTATAHSAETIQLTWNYIGNDHDYLTGFQIFRSDKANGTYQVVGLVGAGEHSFLDTGLIAADTSYYKVTALNSSGSSTLSALASATTKTVSLSAPSNLSVSADTDEMTITWIDNSNSETGYIVERLAPGASEFQPLAALNPNVTIYKDMLYLTDGIFSYRVKALAESTESEYAYTSYERSFDKRRELYLPIILTDTN